jgi:hypothetical protein
MRFVSALTATDLFGALYLPGGASTLTDNSLSFVFTDVRRIAWIREQTA